MRIGHIPVTPEALDEHLADFAVILPMLLQIRYLYFILFPAHSRFLGRKFSAS